MTISHTKIFKSNTSQAVRLSKSVEYPESVKEVDIVALGNMRIITPAGSGWNEWFENKQATDDFMSSRNQEDDQQRDQF
ncbi:MAG: antitoxin [Gammaproteobacteria bacterium]|nr:antitoxin [Gammaproteobacteria bacterium]